VQALPSPSAHAEGGTKGASGTPVVIVSDPEVLADLEKQGLDFGTAVTGSPAASAAELLGRPSYRVLVDTMTADLAEARGADPASGVGMQFSHRQFDVRFLSSSTARFELAGVVNRVDRRPFAPEYCGEVRLVYLLSYRAERASGAFESRLPMTVNVVSYLPRDAASSSGVTTGGCAEAARAWMRPPGVRERDEEPAWLTSSSGPLSPARRAAWTPKSVELNFQSVRWPATVRPQLGGHAEYVLRVFKRTSSPPGLVAGLLENTPDVPRIAKNAALKKELAAFLASPEALAKLDEGTLVIPDAFLSTRAISVAPHGLARKANRAFERLFSAEGFAPRDLSTRRVARSPAALLRRLDTLSCAGCHQSRSIAGFHLLGVESKEDRIDAIEVPMSPHLHGDLGRRSAYVQAIASGRTPDDFRPPAERSPADTGRAAHCGLGDPGFADWTCAPGLRCAPGIDPEVGTCEAEVPAVGDGCESGAVRADADSHRDGARLARRGCAGGRICEATSVGFPGGMCAGDCTALSSEATCGGIAILDAFNACLGRGEPFERCIAQHTRPGALQACDFHTACRDDYVCARTPSGGGCIPPYFLFQLRVDGHQR
jgi:hypothetical protein